MSDSKDPLHGITLEMMLRDVIELHGYKELGEMTTIKKFDQEGKHFMKPVLKFIRKTPWAKSKIEEIYKRDLDRINAMKVNK